MSDVTKNTIALTIGKDPDLLDVQAFNIDMDVFQTPCRFSVTMNGDDFATRRKRYAPNMDFGLYIRKAGETKAAQLLFSGRIDSIGCSGGAEGETEMLIRGRDHLSQLETQAPSDFTYQGTYEQIVNAAIQDAFRDTFDGLQGVDQKEGEVHEIDIGPARHLGTHSPNEWAYKVPPSPAVIRGGSSYFCFLKNLLCKTPLVLNWSAPHDEYRLFEPGIYDDPTHQITHTRYGSNVLTFNHDFDITGRACNIVCYGRGRGKKEGVTLSDFDVYDKELYDLGVRKRAVMVDKLTTSPQEAEYHALRNLAAARRDGWSLQYTVEGLLSELGLPWLPNTVVSVFDSVLFGGDPDRESQHLYLESVTMVGDEKTTHTTIKLTQPEALKILNYGPGTKVLAGSGRGGAV